MFGLNYKDIDRRLYGISDAAERKEVVSAIIKDIEAQTSPGASAKYACAAGLLGSAIAGLEYVTLRPMLLALLGYPIGFGVGLVGAIGISVYALSKWRTAHGSMSIARSLARMSRCTGCGYPIDEKLSRVCPECGGRR